VYLRAEYYEVIFRVADNLYAVVGKPSHSLKSMQETKCVNKVYESFILVKQINVSLLSSIPARNTRIPTLMSLLSNMNLV